MKDEMGKVCGTRRLAPNAGGLVGVASGRLRRAPMTARKQNITDGNGVAFLHRTGRASSEHVAFSVIFRFLRFHPLGAAIMPSGIACAPLYHKRPFAVDLPQTPVRVTGRNNRPPSPPTHGQCEAVEAFARPPSPRLRRDKQGLFPAGSKAAPVEVSGRKPTGRGATEPRRKAPIQRRRQYPKFFSVCFAGSKPCAADLRNQCSAFSRFFGTPPPL